MRQKHYIYITTLFVLLHSLVQAGDLIATPLGYPVNVPGNDWKIISNPQSWGYPYLTTTGIMVISLLFSWLLVNYVAKRRIEEGKIRKTILTLLGLAMGTIFGTAIILMLPKAYGSQIIRYGAPDGQEVDIFNLYSSSIPSLLLLLSFFFFLIIDLVARHFIARTHMSTTRVPGISHSPAETVRIDEQGRRVTYVPGGGATGTVVSTQEQVIRAERISTEPRSEGWRFGGRIDGEGTKKQTVLILLRQFMYTFFTGLAIGTIFASRSAYNILSLCIALCICTVLLQMVDTVLLYYSGVPWKRCLLWNFLWNALMWGTVAIGRALGSTNRWDGLGILLAAEVGAYLYLVTVHLMPALVKGKKYDLKAGYLFAFAFGTFAMYGIRAIEA